MARRGGAKDTYGAGFARLDEWIRTLRTAGQIVPLAAQELVPVVRGEVDAAIDAQRSLDGTAWPAKKDGSRALANAPSQITVKAVGNTILVVMVGHLVFHQFGTHRMPARPVLPRGGMPDKLGNAIRLGIVDMGLEWMTRKGRHDRGSRGVRMKPSLGGG